MGHQLNCERLGWRIFFLLTFLGLMNDLRAAEESALRVYRDWNTRDMDDPRMAERMADQDLTSRAKVLGPEEELQIRLYLLRQRMSHVEPKALLEELKPSQALAKNQKGSPEAALLEIFEAIIRLSSRDDDQSRAIHKVILEGIDRAKDSGQQRLQAHLMVLAAEREYDLGEVSQGLKHVQEVLLLLEGVSAKDEPDIVNAKQLLSQFLDPQGEPEKAALVLQDLITVLSRKPYRYKLAVVHRSLGMAIARQRKDLPLAEREYRLALEVAQSLGHKLLEGQCLVTLAGVFTLMKKVPEAVSAIEEALALLNSHQANSIEIADAYRIQARTLMLAKRYELALKSIERAMIPKAIVDKNFLILLVDLKAQALALLGRFEEAYVQRTEFADLQQKIQDMDKETDMNRLKVDLGLKIEEDQNRLLQTENELQRRRLADEALFRQLTWFACGVAIIMVALLGLNLRKTRQIRKNEERMKRILDNIEEGILTIGPGMKVESDLSPYLRQVLGGDGQDNMLHKLIAGMDLSEEEKATIRSVLQTVVDEDIFNWEANHVQLPLEVSFEKGQRFLSLEWQALKEGHRVSAILLCLRDVTARRQLQQEVDQVRSDLEKWNIRQDEIMRLDQRRAGSFLRELASSLPFVLEHLPKKLEIATCFRRLHTIKGIARTLGFKELSQKTHLLEDTLEADRSAIRDEASMVPRLKEFEKVAHEYQDLLERKFPGSRAVRDQDLSLHEVLSQNLGAARQTLEKANFTLESIEVKDAFLHWDDKLFQDVSAILSHGLTNSIDHGYVLPRQQGRLLDNQVRLQIEARAGRETLELELRDNGVGLDMKKLRSLAESHGFQPNAEQDWTDFLFQDGVSTVVDLSQTSGRGVGLAAIREICQRWQGRVRLQINDRGQGTLLKVDLPINRELQAAS